MTRAKCKILPFPTDRKVVKLREAKPPINAVRLNVDFDVWYVDMFSGGSRVRFTKFDDRQGAEAEVERLAAGGLRRLPNGPYVPQREAAR